MEELINTIITQAPNFIGFVVATAFLWRQSVKLQSDNSELIDRIIQMSKDCDCDRDEPPASPRTPPPE